MYNERKVAQMPAYLLVEGGKTMPHLKLLKLLYLADRKSMELHGFPISGDCIVAMPHGPVLSMTLNLIDGDVESCENGWESWVSDKANHEVSLKRAVSSDALDELSMAGKSALEAVWNTFGHMDKWEIRDYTHNHCPEWQDPNGSSRTIPYETVFRALGKPDNVAIELGARIEAERSLDTLFASL